MSGRIITDAGWQLRCDNCHRAFAYKKCADLDTLRREAAGYINGAWLSTPDDRDICPRCQYGKGRL